MNLYLNLQQIFSRCRCLCSFYVFSICGFRMMNCFQIKPWIWLRLQILNNFSFSTTEDFRKFISSHISFLLLYLRMRSDYDTPKVVFCIVSWTWYFCFIVLFAWFNLHPFYYARRQLIKGIHFLESPFSILHNIFACFDIVSL